MPIGDVIAIVLGLVVGLSLGALGGGGSTLAVPILVFIAGLTTGEATTAALIVVGVAALAGAIGHYRHGHVRVGAGLAFGAAGIVGSKMGTWLNASLPEDLLLLAFAVLVIFVAIRMYRSATRARGDAAVDDGEQLEWWVPDEVPTITTATTHAPATQSAATQSATTQAATTRSGTTRTTAARAAMTAGDYAKLAAAATVVGVLTGLFGVGGGFAVVPALVIFMKFDTKDAIGTSLLVIAINTAIALFLRRHRLDSFDWTVVGPFIVTTTIGVIVGLRAARNIDADRLTRGFAVMLALVALYTAGTVVIPTII